MAQGKKRKRLLKILKYFAIIVLGNSLYAFGVRAFIEPSGLITGGCTGISLFLSRTLHISFIPDNMLLPIISFILNAIFFFIGLIFIGKKFALTTLASTIIFPIVTAILGLVDLSVFYLDDIWLNVICAGVIIGVGLGFIVRSGASTGGMDIPAILINRKVKFISIGTALIFFDCVAMIVQIPTAGFENFIFGAILAVIYSGSIDKVILFGKTKIQMLIISKHQVEIQQMIMTEFDRGVTLMHSQTGYLKEEIETILTVVDMRELAKVKDRVTEIDPDAFLVINKVNEVAGRGFTTKKVYHEHTNQE